MKILFYKGLTRNPEIGNTSAWVLPSIWRLRRVRDTKFGNNFSHARVTTFTISELLRENQKGGGGGGGKITSHPDLG